MLILSRKRDEKIIIGDGPDKITICYLSNPTSLSLP
jgi:sRNA-binding carbon storage regulator CsrA